MCPPSSMPDGAKFRAVTAKPTQTAKYKGLRKIELNAVSGLSRETRNVRINESGNMLGPIKSTGQLPELTKY